MKLLLSLLILGALLVSGSASAQSAPRAHTAVKLLACDPVTHSALFQGSMQAFGRATTLQMRFTLQVRDAVGPGRWARVGAPPPFEQWLTAEAGAKRYVYDKGVDNLPVGAAYRAIVRFRFRAADGTVVARDVRKTRKCRQPDNRPDLEVRRLIPLGLNGDGTREYEVQIENTGASNAPEAALALDVNGQRVEVLASDVAVGDIEYETVTGPACPPGANVVAIADVNQVIDERDEDDNTLTVPCPSAAM